MFTVNIQCGSKSRVISVDSLEQKNESVLFFCRIEDYSFGRKRFIETVYACRPQHEPLEIFVMNDNGKTVKKITFEADQKSNGILLDKPFRVEKGEQIYCAYCEECFAISKCRTDGRSTQDFDIRETTCQKTLEGMTHGKMLSNHINSRELR